MRQNILLLSALFAIAFANAQVGINTETPQKTLHVNGSLQITNELNVGGNGTTAGNTGTNGQVLISKGANQAPSWQTLAIPTLPTLATGTVISIAGELMIAQEITALMTQDTTLPATSGTVTNLIPYLTNEIIDNENSFTANATTNSFTVVADGIYQIMLNVQISNTVIGTQPVVGIWCNTDAEWVARVNDQYNPYDATGKQTYTLITGIQLSSSKTYSFRAANSSAFTIRAFSTGSTGSGPVTYVSVRRLK